MLYSSIASPHRVVVGKLRGALIPVLFPLNELGTVPTLDDPLSYFILRVPLCCLIAFFVPSPFPGCCLFRCACVSPLPFLTPYWYLFSLR